MRKSIPLSLFVASLLALFLSPLAAAATPDGVSVPILSGASALSSPMGVRSEGMGEANTGRADDLSAFRYNPAGLSMMGYWEWGFNSHTLPSAVQANSLALTAPLPYGNLGIYGQLFTVRDSLQADQGRTAHPDRDKYSYHTGLSYAAPVVNRHFHAGGTVKFFGADFSSNNLSGAVTPAYPLHQRGVFFDLGVLAHYDLSDLKGMFFYLPQVSIGFAARNLHPQFKMSSEINDQYNQEYNVGVSAYFSHKFMLNFDVVSSQNLNTLFRTGIEIWPIYFLALRGGFTAESAGGSYRAAHWGLGIGESVGPSKVSLEYSGKVVLDVSSYASSELYHSFAIHQSFENILTYKDRYGKTRRIPLALADRYSSSYRFAREILPEEIIDDAITIAQGEKPQDTSSKKTVRPKDDKAPPVIPEEPETPKQPDEPVVKRKRIAVYPFVEDFTTSKPFNNTYGDNLRGAILEFILSKQKILRPMSDMRYKLTPKRESHESDIDFMNRLCNFHGLDLIVFPVLILDDRNTNLTVKMMYYKAGDKETSAVDERTSDYDRFAVLKAEVTKDFSLQVASLLDIDLSGAK